MKPLLSASVLATAALTLGATAYAQSSSPSAAASCGPNTVRCMSGYQARCEAGVWRCSKLGCLARCPDGHEYRTCTDEGYPINYFADPCMNHYASSSASSVSSAPSSSSASSVPAGNCGPNPILCVRTMRPACADGRWTCVPLPRSSSSRALLRLTSLDPVSGRAGSWVTVEGSGFAPQGNIVQFGRTVVAGRRSPDGTHLSFRVPAMEMSTCELLEGDCKPKLGRNAPGTYPVTIRSRGGASNALDFTLKAR